MTAAALRPDDRDRLARPMCAPAMDQSHEKIFAARLAAFLKKNFASPTQVAAAFCLRERSAEYWWAGVNATSGAKAAWAALHPDLGPRLQTGRRPASAGRRFLDTAGRPADCAPQFQRGAPPCQTRPPTPAP